ncbi:helix-turn-helix domain-containing protein [Luteimonas suaedae]|uniref:helix-turn-helix domain-containing protein n=1 Tax=Luteimonas suaedae TaxID=2605430 RepID=UPI001658CE15|nr:helix-turn-helix domain-containing protein [Luteimonas suaedae]
MILLPSARLRPYVASLWVGERPVAPDREQVLPTGTMHIALRLQGGPVRLYGDRGSTCVQHAGDALVAGARAGSYWKDASVPTRTVGVQLRPGAARALFGASAAEFSDRHVPLDDAWGRDGTWLREALHEARDPHAQLAALEAALLARLAPRAMHPSVARALAQIRAIPSAERLPAVAGISQRHFIAQFREATGLSPKRYARVCRFQYLLRLMEAGRGHPLAELASAAGYSDQSHCNREFLALAGTTPHAWQLQRRARPPAPPMPRRARSVSSKTPV